MLEKCTKKSSRRRLSVLEGLDVLQLIICSDVSQQGWRSDRTQKKHYVEEGLFCVCWRYGRNQTFHEKWERQPKVWSCCSSWSKILFCSPIIVTLHTIAPFIVGDQQVLVALDDLINERIDDEVRYQPLMFPVSSGVIPQLERGIVSFRTREVLLYFLLHSRSRLKDPPELMGKNGAPSKDVPELKSLKMLQLLCFRISTTPWLGTCSVCLKWLILRSCFLIHGREFIRKYMSIPRYVHSVTSPLSEWPIRRNLHQPWMNKRWSSRVGT